MKNRKTTIYLLITAILCLGLIVASLFLFDVFDNGSNGDDDSNTEEVIKQPFRDKWLNNKSINDDYQGEIVFDSGLINQPFVQAKNAYDKSGQLYHFYTSNGTLVTNGSAYNGNDVYIWTNWRDMTYDYDINGGSIFMDYRCSLDSQNIIIYGHCFFDLSKDPDRVKSFSPLEKLLKEENYTSNNKLTLVLDNEDRVYELACVYIFDVDNDEMMDSCQYWRNDYSYDDYSRETNESYFEEYINCIYKYGLYDTDVMLDINDKTLTLQTCVAGSLAEYEICVFKLIDTVYYQSN